MERKMQAREGKMQAGGPFNPFKVVVFAPEVQCYH
jgi:hypothetical protein